MIFGVEAKADGASTAAQLQIVAAKVLRLDEIFWEGLSSLWASQLRLSHFGQSHLDP